ncbi:PREDICTED: uncharacterized protein LOC106334457 [Brassica oleracea var. oleracea]|uniref:uncharacterized protein LOC106334457 n=1 Tax=Brassica oleracea var. oleracea TaxID=109376 RepID=UPI0006A71C10|nr:PREDICTED: uncharacterized protein LOC106334457 [Brassica oleracea var. oleracea]
MIGKSLRRFSPAWFDQYGNWLEYSVSTDRAYCLCCYLFRDDIHKQGGNDTFVTEGFSSWNKSERLASHVGGMNSFHNIAVKMCDSLMKYLLRQGIPFRAHDESEDSGNKGNFLELIRYTADQNEAVLVKSIIEEVDHGIFGLLVDESADISHKEQMAVVLRFVDKNGTIKERFIGVVHVKETSSLTFKLAIDDLFAKYGLSLKNIRGQGYDGAIGASCKRQDVVKEKYREEVKKGISSGEISTGKGKNQERSLPRPSNTRWGSHHKTLVRLVELFSILQEFNDRFTEVNTQLLICMAFLSPTNSFKLFDKEKLMKLVEFYPDDFSFFERSSLEQQLDIYIDNIREDGRFHNLESLGDLSRLMVETRKHLVHPLVYRLLKLALTLPVATATVERCFSAMKFVKTASRKRIGDQFLSDCLVCFIEKDLFASVTNETVVKKFQSMAERRVCL